MPRLRACLCSGCSLRGAARTPRTSFPAKSIHTARTASEDRFTNVMMLSSEDVVERRRTCERACARPPRERSKLFERRPRRAHSLGDAARARACGACARAPRARTCWGSTRGEDASSGSRRHTAGSFSSSGRTRTLPRPGSCCGCCCMCCCCSCCCTPASCCCCASIRSSCAEREITSTKGREHALARALRCCAPLCVTSTSAAAGGADQRQRRRAEGSRVGSCPAAAARTPSGSALAARAALAAPAVCVCARLSR